MILFSRSAFKYQGSQECRKVYVTRERMDLISVVTVCILHMLTSVVIKNLGFEASTSHMRERERKKKLVEYTSRKHA